MRQVMREPRADGICARVMADASWRGGVGVLPVGVGHDTTATANRIMQKY
jgi:hypothetical protein